MEQNEKAGNRMLVQPTLLRNQSAFPLFLFHRIFSSIFHNLFLSSSYVHHHQYQYHHDEVQCLSRGPRFGNGLQFMVCRLFESSTCSCCYGDGDSDHANARSATTTTIRSIVTGGVNARPCCRQSVTTEPTNTTSIISMNSVG
jgi:hypothetical protein